VSTTARPKRRLPPDQRRRHLIDTAITLYSQRSFDQVSVDDIIRAADVSRALFYRYFKNPGELFMAGAEMTTDRLVRRLSQPFDGTAIERLRHGLTEFLSVVEQHPESYLAVVRNASAVNPELGGVVNKVRNVIVDLIVGRVGLANPAPMIELTLRCWT
jgi:AcrR family transcriptional regulator